MTNNNQKTDTNNKASSTIDQVFRRIEAESITPTAKITFTVTQWGIWFLWGLTLICGAAALAIGGYVTMSAQYALYEATHENFLTFMVAVMPFIWVGLFACMAYISVYEIKKTKRGYRYSTLFILGSNVICAFILAMLLHQFGLGYALDKELGEQIGMYMSLEKKELMMWQMPQEGRLVGILEPIVITDTEDVPIYNFKDTKGVLWRLNVEELSEREMFLLNRSLPVRLIGTTTSDFSFHACGVFPWLSGRAIPRREMQEHRQEFDAMMLDKMNKLEAWGKELGEIGLKKPETDSQCADLPVMNRLR